MISVIIADDEPKIRQNLIDLIEWEHMGLTLATEVPDGDSLLDYLRKVPAEIALIDMKMPGLSGGCLIQRLNKEYPSLKLVVISGYDDFEYTKAAINANVMGYILKPVDPEELKQVLGKCIHSLEVENLEKKKAAQQKMALRMYDSLLVNSSFWRLLEYDSASTSRQELLSCLELKDWKDWDSFCGCLVILKLETALIPETPAEDGGMHWTLYSIQNILEELFSGFGKVFCHSDNQTAALMLYRFLPRPELEKKLNSGILYIRRFCRMIVYAGVSSAANDPESLHRLYTEALDTVMNHPILCENPVAWYSDSHKEAPKNILENYLPTISEAASSPLPLAFQVVMNTYRKLMEEADLSLRDLLTFNQAAFSLLISTGKPLNAPSITRQLYALQKDALHEMNPAKICSLLSSFLHRNEELLMSDSESKLAHQLKKDIDRNLHQSISIDDLARTYHFSKTYLFRVFKQKFHISPHQYLLERKVEKAKILLMNPDMKVSEIADLLDFSDESHFSKVFKRLTGISPKQYRINHR